MKKLALLFLSLLVAAGASLFCACGGSGNGSNGGNDNGGGNGGGGSVTETLLNFSGITFADKTVEYDGTEQSLIISGSVPAGTSVVYTNNKGTQAGEYKASVTLKKDGYNDLTLTAKLTINKASFKGLTLENKTFVATGKAHSLEVEGNLPENTSVQYTGNAQTAAGEYTVTAKITNPNYKDLTLTAKLKIISVPAVATDIVNSLLDKPDAWSFLPEALAKENMAYTSAPVTDFTSFVNASKIGNKIIGKQLHVLYEGLNYAETALGYVDTVSSVAATIAGVYQNFINDNPENYASFSGSAAGFKIKITLVGDRSEIIAGNSTVSIELSYDKTSGVRTGRIQITDGVAIKYEYGESSLNLALKATIAGVGNLKQIEFARSGGAVAGYLREFTGTESKNLKTSAVISSNASLTKIMSNKRESDDLLIKGYEEVYSSVSGRYLGGEVQETVKAVDFDTLWFMLGDVSGINSVKILNEKNGLNADTVFVNGAATAFVTEKVGGINLKRESRRYDIEMKDVWYVVATEENGRTKYDTVKCHVPMLFVQLEQAGTFGKDVRDKNPSGFAAEPSLPAYTVVTESYAALQKLFNEIKDKVTYAEIDAFIGNKNSYLA